MASRGVATSTFWARRDRTGIGRRRRWTEIPASARSLEAAPIRYVAELIGADTDAERAIRLLIALMALCCDPLAIALTAAASSGR